ncbi:hypothetical protein C8R41DRAFT_925654 [Lentinula lateritia]|uniref:Uncharacterized protein n=1 Tax=Lentinula lateritia TaxID=40482 RepID=A0ABQ8V0J7_9AGAR|nr:hypothetical protein C8R41DRAFT_925654 [Lentinula lateritia]
MSKPSDNVKATPRVEPRTASPLPPIKLEDVHPPAQSLGTYPPGRIPSRELTTSRLIPTYDLFESYIDILARTSLDLLGTPSRVTPIRPATTRSFLSSVAVPVAPFELQLAPSTLQHKPFSTKPYLKAYSDPGLTVTSCLLRVHASTGTILGKCDDGTKLSTYMNVFEASPQKEYGSPVSSGNRNRAAPSRWLSHVRHIPSQSVFPPWSCTRVGL